MSENRDPNPTVDDSSDPLDRGLVAAFGPDSSSVVRALGASVVQLRPSTADPSAAGLPAETSARLQLHGEIARGGMGAVLHGRDVDLGRDVAVKVLLEAHAERDAMVRRFVEEAQIAGQLQHPGVVPIYEMGQFSDKRPYFTMKLVQGRTLAELLAARTEPSEERLPLLKIFEEVCQAVAFAHSKGVVHRDLKPSNVMVGAFGEVQVMDWGLAKVLARSDRPDGEGDATEDLVGGAAAAPREPEGGPTTASGTVLGTPAYMAPEQALGLAGSVDEGADVFSLGAILCEVFTGRPPYDRDDRERALDQARRWDVYDAYRRLDGCDADRELRQLARLCLAANPRSRPRDAGEVARRLAAYRTSVQERLRQAELERAAAEARAAEERRRRRAVAALAAVVVVAVAGAAAGGLWYQTDRARLAGERVRRAAVLRQGVEDALAQARAWQREERLTEAGVALAQARQRLGEDAPDDLTMAANAALADLELQKRLDQARLAALAQVGGKLNDAASARAFAEALGEARLARVGEPIEAAAERLRASAVAPSLLVAVDEWAIRTKDEAERAWLLQVARRADPEPWRDRVRDAARWRDRAVLEKLAAEPGVLDQPPHLVRGLAVRLDAVGGDALGLLRAIQARRPQDFWLNLEIGKIAGRTSPAEGVAFARAAVALRPDSTVSHNNLAYYQMGMGRDDEARASLVRALDLDPKNPHALLNLGFLERKAGRRGANLELQRRAVACGPEIAVAHYNLGVALHVDFGQLDEAIPAYQRAIELDPQNVLAHNNLANVLKACGRLDEAIVLYRKALAIDANHFLAHHNLGNAYKQLGRLDDAAAEYAKASATAPTRSEPYEELAKARLCGFQVAAALAAVRRATELTPPADPYREKLLRAQRRCDLLLPWEARLPALAAGTTAPTDARERLLLGHWYAEGGDRHAAAARHYATAFAADPRLADDLASGNRYGAACSAALAASGQSEDAKNLDDKERNRLRSQGVAWLRADLALWTKALDGGNPQARVAVCQTLSHWQKDTDLAGLRDQDAVAKLSKEERETCEKLWADVAALLAKAEEKKGP